MPANGAPHMPHRGLVGNESIRRCASRELLAVAKSKYAFQSSGASGSPGRFPACFARLRDANRCQPVNRVYGIFPHLSTAPAFSDR
jgi:hypothetical protein